MDGLDLVLGDGTRVTIRAASVRDAAGIVDLDRVLSIVGDGMVLTVDQLRTVDETAKRIDDTYRAMSAGDATLAAVAVVGDRVIGTADLRQLAPTRVRHVGLLSVGVAPDFRRRGVARALMRYLIDHAWSCGLLRLELYVREDNPRARALYESLGFHHEGTRRRFVKRDDGSFVDDLIYALFR